MAMRSSLVASAVVGLGLLIQAYAHGGVIVVDDFSSKDPRYWPFSVTQTTGPNMGEGVSEEPPNSPVLSGVLGGGRLSFLENVQIANHGVDSAQLDIDNSAGNSLMNYESTAGASARLSLGYGATQDPFPYGPIDGTSLTSIDIAVHDYEASGKPMSVSAVLFGGGLGVSIPSVQVTQSGVQTIEIPISAADANLVPSNTGLEVDFDLPAGATLQLDSITMNSTAVPEPLCTSAALLALLMCRRNRSATGT
jgi:hypothetical protein